MTNKHNLWDQMPGEPDLWFDRFEVYLRLGSARSFTRAYQVVKGDIDGEEKGSPGQAWSRASREWSWAERARAWDQAEREQFLKEEEQLRTDARLSRLQMIRELQNRSYTALMTAAIDRMDEHQARQNLAQLRLLFLGLSEAERVEYGGVPDDKDKGAAISPEMDKTLQDIIDNLYPKSQGEAG